MDDNNKSKPIQIDEVCIRAHLGEMHGTVKQALNAILDADANRLCGASNEGRKDTRAGQRSVPRPEGRAGEAKMAKRR